MAGEIQLNSTTMATESSGSITAEMDTIRPNTTNGSLTLQGDSSDAGVTGLTIDSSGNATFAQTISGGTIGSSVVFPAGHILRTFYDESDAAQESITTTASTFSELDISIASGASTSDYILIILNTNGIFNGGLSTSYIQIGLQYSTDDWSSSSQLGSVEFYDRPGYATSASNTGLIVSSSISVRVNHPTTSAYRIRPWYQAAVNTMYINQPALDGTGPRSTMTVFEIKG